MNPIRYLYRTSPRARRALRLTKNRVTSRAAQSAFDYVAKKPLDQALALGDRVGALAYRVLRQQRDLAEEHVRHAFGDTLAPALRTHLVRSSFMNVARCFIELAKIDEIRARRAEYFEVVGWHHAEKVLAAGRGAVVVTGHIGNWELLAAYWAWSGHPVVAIARRIYAEELNRMLVNFRERQGVETVLRESPNSARQILAAMKRNALLAMLIDQDTKVQSVSVPFFGRLARTPVAAASLAVRRELPAVAAFIQRRPEGGHRITILPPFEIERTGDVHADIKALTRRFNDAIERQIRANPAEWVWWHRRWRRGPIVDLDLDPAVA
ncbi:MAG TPA: lysophospholipid acyltransferase family protein [Terriglobales bacterium]|nr:lysophospholipid acyltransferase family protein [Terriglobales bacterium]